MDKLRDFLKSWPGRILLMLCLAPVVFIGLEGIIGGGSLSSNQVVRINKDVNVDMSTLQQEITLIHNNAVQQAQDIGLIDDAAVKAQALDNVINRTLLELQAKLLGMQNSKEMITRLLQVDPQFLDADGRFSNDLFAQFLMQRGMTKDMLFANYGTQMSIRQLMMSILNNAIYPMPQVNRLIDLQLESRPLWVRRLAWQDYADKVTISDGDIQAYFDTHQDKLSHPEMVDLVYLQLGVDNVVVEPNTEAELKTAYEAYVKENGKKTQKLAQILLTNDQSPEKITKIQAELQAGKDFLTVAKQYSDDVHSIELGTYNAAVFGADAAKVDAALMSLNEGDVSTPVHTAFGVHIFKVIQSTQAVVPSFDEMKDKLNQDLLAQKRLTALNDQIVAVNNMVADSYSLHDIAKELKLTVKTLPNYRKIDNQTTLNQPMVIRAAFDEVAIHERRVSDRIEIADTSVWVQSDNYRPVTPMTLEQAKNDIRQQLTIIKASELAFKEAQSLAKTMDKQTVVQLQSLGLVNRQNPYISDKERLSLFVHKAPTDDVVAWAVLTDEGASVLVGGEITTEAQSRMNDMEKSLAIGMMRNVVGQDRLEDYLHYLRQVHTVQVNEEALKSL